MISHALPDFWRRYHRLPLLVRQHAKAIFMRFIENPFHPSLHFKELKRYHGIWSVRITASYRVVGRRQGQTIHWFWIGNHADFDREFS